MKKLIKWYMEMIEENNKNNLISGILVMFVSSLIIVWILVFISFLLFMTLMK